MNSPANKVLRAATRCDAYWNLSDAELRSKMAEGKTTKNNFYITQNQSRVSARKHAKKRRIDRLDVAKESGD